jgi:hypothetical protein
MIRFVLLVTVMLGSSQATAQARTAYGAGGNSCGVWTQARETKNSMKAQALDQWVAGYVSGANMCIS